MAANPDNACLSRPVPAATEGEPHSVEPTLVAQASASDYPQDLLQNYTQLSERYHRTTNALGSAAHDLKTPLSILNGYIELLQSEKLGPVSDRQREVLQDMRDSGKRLQQFIQDFLTFSALETGGLRMQFDTANINDVLSGVCKIWS